MRRRCDWDGTAVGTSVGNGGRAPPPGRVPLDKHRKIRDLIAPDWIPTRLLFPGRDSFNFDKSPLCGELVGRGFRFDAPAGAVRPRDSSGS